MAAAAEKRLLFFSPLLAMPGQHGGCVYPHAILTELHRQGWAVDYAWTGAPLQRGRRRIRNPLTASYVSTAWIRGGVRCGPVFLPSTAAGWLGRGERLPFDASLHGGEHPATPAERAFAARLVRRLRPANILIDSTPMLTLLDDLAPAERAAVRVSVLTHNLTSRRTELYRQFGQPLDFLPMTRDEERALLVRADVIVAIQEREAADFRALLPGRRVVTVPMPLSPAPQPPDLARRHRCLFVGGFSGHNIEAVRWLLSEVWPAVLAQIPDAELVIAGTVGRSVAEPPPGVVVAGPVEDLSSAYAAAAVCLVPLPLGTGLKIKLVEAMSFGRAVLTTPAGAEGFPELEAGDVAAVAADAPAYARELLALLGDPARREALVQRQTAWLERTMRPPAALAAYTALL